MEADISNTTFMFGGDYYYFANNSASLPSTVVNETTPLLPAAGNVSIEWKGTERNMATPEVSSEGEWGTYDWNGAPYPSGYSQMRIIITAFFVTFIMVVIVVGNMLVCIAIATEKALKTVQNWFIASLAVSDFLVGLVIMPFSLAKELMGYWIFGNLWCEIHAALDVLLCTASINNLCLISLDRYWSVTQAVEYLKKRTPTRAVLMIFFVWMLSALISLPPLLGWKKEDKPEDYPSCSLSDDVGYVLYSALGSFYVPAFVMVFVYIRIFMAARSRARRHVKKPRQASEVTNDPHRDKSTTTTTCTSLSNPSPPDKRKDQDYFRFQDQPKLNGGKRDSPVTPTMSNMPQIIIEATQELQLPSPTLFQTEIHTHPQTEDIPEESQEDDEQDDDEEEDYRKALTASDDEKGRRLIDHSAYAGESLSSGSRLDSDDGITQSALKTTISVVSNPQTHSPRSYTYAHQSLRRSSAKGMAPRRSRTTIETTMSLTDSISVGSAKGSDTEASELCPMSSVLKKGKKLRGALPLRTHGPLITTPSDAERQKRRIAKARERRATLILGLIMAAFILAWLPFFVLYVLAALCDSCNVGPTGFATAFWLGYCNSALNPIIYTIFNRDFRRAFKKILLK